jgi:hypothetical protein
VIITAPPTMNLRCTPTAIWLAIATTASLRADELSQFAPLRTQILAPESVPAEMSNHAMYVNVMVNGRGPFRMFMDTGCSVTVISPKLAAAIGPFIPNAAGASVDALNGFGDMTAVEPVVLETLSIGGATFEGVEACVSDSFDRISEIDNRRVDGALGYSLFADLYLALDFPNRRILLSNQWPADIPPVRTVLPVAEHTDVPFVQIQIQGKTFEAMIDTGFNQDLKLPVGLSQAVRWKERPRPGALVAVFGEVDRESIGRLDGALSWGDVRQNEPTASVSRGSPSVGVRFLQHFCVVFHESEDRVWLCSSDREPIASPAERSIGLSIISDAAGWRVAGIIPGSPAEDAHVQAGDLVTRIEGEPARSWTRDQLRRWMNTHDRVALVVANDSGARNITLRVWSLVP